MKITKRMTKPTEINSVYVIVDKGVNDDVKVLPADDNMTVRDARVVGDYGDDDDVSFLTPAVPGVWMGCL